MTGTCYFKSGNVEVFIKHIENVYINGRSGSGILKINGVMKIGSGSYILDRHITFGIHQLVIWIARIHSNRFYR